MSTQAVSRSWAPNGEVVGEGRKTATCSELEGAMGSEGGGYMLLVVRERMLVVFERGGREVIAGLNGSSSPSSSRQRTRCI